VSLGRVTTIQQYFLECRGEYDEADGAAVGIRLMRPDRKNLKKPWKVFDATFDQHRGLRELAKELPWFKAFLEKTIRCVPPQPITRTAPLTRFRALFARRGRLARNRALPHAKLECLSEEEAIRVGANLPQALRQRKTADAGIYQWSHQNPCVLELFEKYPWVESMILEIAKEVLNTAPWGLWFRVVTGSGLSMVDLATDLNVIFVYLNQDGQHFFGWAMLAMIITNMAMQVSPPPRERSELQAELDLPTDRRQQPCEPKASAPTTARARQQPREQTVREGGRARQRPTPTTPFSCASGAGGRNKQVRQRPKPMSSFSCASGAGGRNKQVRQRPCARVARSLANDRRR
jgi:hypothetical protein